MQVNVNEAKTQLSRLIQRVLDGEEVIIARARKPLVKLVRVETPESKRVLGLNAGKIRIESDFNEPLDDFQDYLK